MTVTAAAMTVTTAKTPGKFLVDCKQPGCYRYLTFDIEEDALHDLDTHPCPWSGPTKVSWEVTKTLVQQMWEKLDAEVAAIKKDATAEQMTYHKYRAMAIAECIVIFMQPFFPTSQDVSREALKRWQAKQDGDTDYETAGLGQRRYEAAVIAAEPHASAAAGWYGTPDGSHTSDPAQAGTRAPRAASGRARATAATQRDVVIKLTDKEQESIRNAHAAMPTAFTPKKLATTYGVSEAVINAVLQA